MFADYQTLVINQINDTDNQHVPWRSRCSAAEKTERFARRTAIRVRKVFYYYQEGNRIYRPLYSLPTTGHQWLRIDEKIGVIPSKKLAKST